VIRSSDLARIRSTPSQVSSAVQAQQLTKSHDPLEELAQEVARRLSSGGGISYQG